MLLKPGICLLETTDHRQEIRSNHLGTVDSQDEFSGDDSMAFAPRGSFAQDNGLAAGVCFPVRLDLLLALDDDSFFEKCTAVVHLGLAAFRAERSLRAHRRDRDELDEPEGVIYFGDESDSIADALFRAGRRQSTSSWEALPGGTG